MTHPKVHIWCPSALQLEGCLLYCISSLVSTSTEVWQEELPLTFLLPAFVIGDMPHVSAKVKP